MVFADLVRLGFACPIIGFAQQIADGGNMCGQLFGIFSQAGRILNDLGNGLFIEGTQLFLFGERTNQLGIFNLVFGRTVH